MITLLVEDSFPLSSQGRSVHKVKKDQLRAGDVLHVGDQVELSFKDGTLKTITINSFDFFRPLNGQIIDYLFIGEKLNATKP